MCSHYQVIKDRERYYRTFGVHPPQHPYVDDVWPGLAGTFIRRPREAESGDDAVPQRESLTGIFGLLPHWAKDAKLARQTYNARSETAHEKPSFRDAWRRAQHCIIPAAAIFEPDWRSGKAIATRIERADGEPMGLAGLWSTWRSPHGEVVHSYTM
ncbi:MAG: SOS response-associated peptidase family protein, partial [Burkholderiales bacterium]